MTVIFYIKIFACRKLFRCYYTPSGIALSMKRLGARRLLSTRGPAKSGREQCFRTVERDSLRRRRAAHLPRRLIMAGLAFRDSGRLKRGYIRVGTLTASR